ncbi:axoneme-associated protein mst101(2) [Drosophila gunungcola]|nr:axoneme-associated protein mst101(2) [Drosophila gunungcola]
MATTGRHLSRSLVYLLRQSRWNRLLLQTHTNLHPVSVYSGQPRVLSSKSNVDDGCGYRKKGKKSNCTSYKKNPCIEGDQPPEMETPEPVNNQLRMQKRRKFMEEKKCKDLSEASDSKCDCDPCSSNSKPVLIKGRRKVRISMCWDKANGCLLYLSKLKESGTGISPGPTYLNHHRSFCKKVDENKCQIKQDEEDDCVFEPLPKPNTPKCTRISRKRKHLLELKNKAAEAKAVRKPETETESSVKNLDATVEALKHSCMLASQKKDCEQKQYKALCEELRTSESQDDPKSVDSLVKCMLAGIRKACAVHAQKMVCQQKYAKEIAAAEAAKKEKEKREGKPIDCEKVEEAEVEVQNGRMSEAEKKKAQDEVELSRILAEIKAKCKKRREEAELEKKREEEERMKKCEEAERKRCVEAERKNKCEEEAAKKKCEGAAAKKKCKEAAAKKKCEEAAAKEKCEEAAAKKKCEEATAKKKCEEAAKKKCQEPAAKMKCDVAATQKKKCEEPDQKKKCEEAQKKKKKFEGAEIKKKCEEAEIKKNVRKSRKR